MMFKCGMSLKAHKLRLLLQLGAMGVGCWNFGRSPTRRPWNIGVSLKRSVCPQFHPFSVFHSSHELNRLPLPQALPQYRKYHKPTSHRTNWPWTVSYKTMSKSKLLFLSYHKCFVTVMKRQYETLEMLP